MLKWILQIWSLSAVEYLHNKWIGSIWNRGLCGHNHTKDRLDLWHRLSVNLFRMNRLTDLVLGPSWGTYLFNTATDTSFKAIDFYVNMNKVKPSFLARNHSVNDASFKPIQYFYAWFISEDRPVTQSISRLYHCTFQSLQLATLHSRQIRTQTRLRNLT